MRKFSRSLSDTICPPPHLSPGDKSMPPSILLRTQRESGDSASAQHMAWQGLISRCSGRVFHPSHFQGVKQNIQYMRNVGTRASKVAQ